MKITFEGATAIRPNPRVKMLSATVAIVGLLIGVAAIELGPELLVAAVVLVFLGSGGYALSKTSDVVALRSREPIAAAREGLYEGERLIVPRDRVRAALPGRHYVLGPVLLLLLARGDTVFVSVEDVESASRMQRALELDDEHRRLEVRFDVSRRSWLVLVGILAILVVWGMRLGRGTLWLLVGAVAGTSVFRHTTLVVGDDGVALRTLRSRFISYQDIESVTPSRTRGGQEARSGLRIALRSGRDVRLNRSRELHSRFGIESSDEPVIERANAALAHFGARAVRAPVLPLALSAQTAGSPADRVRALTRKEPGGDVYRQSATDADALRRVVDEPTLPPRVRAEAAILLGAHGEADDLERIRRAAERSACRPLRQLFESAADLVDEASLARALGRVG